MRLINAHTLKLEEIWDENVEEYAILSHRWEDGEVSFQDMQNPDPAVASNKKGFTKIQKSCEHAVNNRYNYVWIDTCCINKESSAELSEVINSMYRWYKASAVCYTFLSDVHANALSSGHVEQQIKSSMWFTRGWTLQELLAPRHVVFFDQQWDFLGTKQTLNNLLTLRTGIDEAILSGEPLSGRSIAQRMSWASQRVTTRIEDTAYCLLGIFDVNMPMLYGEGEKAFLRLQEEIIKQSDDHTIFAWSIHRDRQPGLLADSPAAFAKCNHIRTMISRKGRSPYSLTNRGLSLRLKATHFTTDTYIVPLDCTNELLPADGPAYKFRLGMFLRRLNEDDQYARVKHEGETFRQVEASTWDFQGQSFRFNRPIEEIGFVRRRVEEIEINVRQRVTEINTNNYKDRVNNGFRIATPELLDKSSSGQDRFRVYASSWDPQERIMSIEPGCFGSLDMRQQDHKIKLVKLGFDFEYNPVCFVATKGGLTARSLSTDSRINFTEEDQAQLLGIFERSTFDKMGWSEVHDGIAYEMRHHSGLWALKADRLNGLHVWVGDIANLRILRGELQDRVVWDVYFDNIRESTSTFHRIFR